MPKKRTFQENNTYVVLFYRDGMPDVATYIGAKAAIDGLRFYRSIYGPTAQLLKVVINSGEEV